MLAFCPKCWNEITNSPTICRKCGASVIVDSQEYERQLLDLIPRGSATKRVEICLLLGQQKRRGAVSHLISIADRDPEAVVRIAALRALGEIGDASAIHEIANVATNQKSPVSAVAQEILRTFEARSGNH
jgi:HEAT repeat protein